MKKIYIVFTCLAIYIAVIKDGNIKLDNIEERQIAVENNISNYDQENALICDEVFEDIKQIYDNLNFNLTIEKGNLNNYELYKEKFKQLLNNEAKFYDKNGNLIYIKEHSRLGNLSVPFEEKNYNFFDMTGDGEVDLCFVENFSTYIFNYDINTDELRLWYEDSRGYSSIIGTRTFLNKGESILYLDKDGENEWYAFFYGEYYTNEKTGENNSAYYISLSKFNLYDEELSQLQKKFGITIFEGEQYAFRVTLEQYVMLRELFLNECNRKMDLSDCTYSYTQLFMGIN